MSLTGLQSAIVIKDVADQLDRDAREVLRRGLEPLAGEALDAIGRRDLAQSEFGLRMLATWMARVPSAAGWRRRAEATTSEPRLPRELVALGLDPNAIHRLTLFIADHTLRNSAAERLITARQRRRNINSQTRQMLKPLDTGWLTRHMDQSLEDERVRDLFATAHRLSEQTLMTALDIERWHQEVSDFRTDFIAADEAESPSLRSAASSDPTTRTYRASWVKFWLDNSIEQILMRLMDEQEISLSVHRMLGKQDGNEGEIRLVIQRPDAHRPLLFPATALSFAVARVPRDAQNDANIGPLTQSAFEPTIQSDMQLQSSTRSGGDRPSSGVAAPASQTRPSALTPLQNDKLRFDFHPQSQPGNGFTRTWPTTEAAASAVARFVDATLRMAVASDLWDFTVTLQTDSGTVAINRSSQTPEQMKTEAARLISQIESLA